MDDFLKMDVFFVIASGALIIVTTLLSIVLYYAIRLMRSAKKLCELIEREVVRVQGDIEEARLTVRREAGQLVALITHARKLAARFLSSRNSRKE